MSNTMEPVDKVVDELINEITGNLAREFPSFGGGEANPGSIIQAALANQSPSFAMGVDIRKVVARVLERAQYRNMYKLLRRDNNVIESETD